MPLWKQFKYYLWKGLFGEVSLETLLNYYRNHHTMSTETENMISGILQLEKMDVADIMIPRAEMITIDEDMELSQIKTILIENEHSRYPVFSEDKEKILGILIAKDLLSLLDTAATNYSLSQFIRPAFFVPETKSLNTLLQNFRADKNHIAIVVDEHGGIRGLVTLEDILEQIVGDIADEHDFEDECFIKKLNAHEYHIKGYVPLNHFYEQFEAPLCLDDDNPIEADTLGGVIIQALGHIPKRHESIQLGAYFFRILSADQRRIRLIQLLYKKPD